MNKPIVNLIGQDGNAFVIMGLCSAAAKKAGWTKEQIESFITEIKSGDYDYLLRVVTEHFEVK